MLTRVVAFAVAFVALGSDSLAASVVVDDTASLAANSTNPQVTIAPSGTDRLLTVCVSLADDTQSVSSATFNGSETLTKLVDVDHGDGQPRGELWYLVAPTATSATVSVTLTAASDVVLGAIAYSGVNQNTPIDGTTSGSGTSDSVFAGATSEVDDLVVDCLARRNSGIGDPMAGSGQVERWNLAQAGDLRGFGSTKTGVAGPVLMSWSWFNNQDWPPWTVIAFNVKMVPPRRVIIVQ